MWLMLWPSPSGTRQPDDTSDDEDTVTIEAAEEPFAGIPDLPHEDDDIVNISSIIIATLAAQKAFVSVDSDGLPEKARDNFSIGYIGGYLDTVLRRRRTATTRTAHTIGEIVFAGVFGSADGFEFYEKYLSLQHAADADVLVGMSTGESDIELWLKNNLNVPCSWSAYVHDCLGTA
jgi:hypothetical protein